MTIAHRITIHRPRPPGAAAQGHGLGIQRPGRERPRVAFLTLILSHYRVPFHNEVRRRLAERGIDYTLIYGAPTGDAALKGDTADVAWGVKLPVRHFRALGKDFYWQDARALVRDAALTIVSQENKLLFNYWLQARYLLGRSRFAFFGHGRNFQSTNPDGPSERFKRALTSRSHWWFAYTPGSADIVEACGFPRDRITTFYNAIDSTGLAADCAAVTDTDVAQAKRALGIASDNIGIFIGGMYEEKRLDFLVEAAQRIRAKVPDFHLLLVGSGTHAGIAADAALAHPFIHHLGPRFGHDKATLLVLSKLLLMPGLVGLAIMDSFAAGRPIVTTELTFHSPEIAYLEEGCNGVMVRDSVEAYAEATAGLLLDEGRRAVLAAGARESAGRYTIERMANLFSEGVCQALERD